MAAIFLSLMVGAVPLAAAAPPDRDRSGVELVDLPEDVPQEAAEENRLTELTTGNIDPEDEFDPQAVAEPAGGQVVEELSDIAPGELVPLGDLPIAVGAPEDASAEATEALEGEWQAALASPEEVAATEIQGLVFSVNPPAEASGEVVVSLDYTEFAELYGAAWADRLDLTRLPSCFLETPEVEACTEPADVSTDQSVTPKAGDAPTDGKLDGTRRITATLDVAELTDDGTPTPSPAVSHTSGATTDALFRPRTGDGMALTSLRQAAATNTQAGTVLMATSKGSGSQGDFAATPLASAGSWSAGGSSGAFTYGYTLNTPVVPGGPSPSLSFNYNSQGVDGRTSATNNQASWIGDGWEYNAGSISRTYRSCRDDAKDGNNEKRKTSDLCWASDNAVLTLGGNTTELVKDDDEKSDIWVTANGDGSKVELRKNSGYANGDADGEHWVVTTRDGTEYWFGRNRLPGWKDGDQATNSVLTAPVAGNHPDEPCYKAAFADSFCAQAWRWNLDYVVDVHDNAMALYWKQETNHYAKNNAFKKAVPYDRGGYLERIDYGLRVDDDKVYGKAPLSRVTFRTEERCFKESDVTCTDANFSSGHHYKNRIWYDTPADLYCKGGSAECYVPVPTFWSRKRLEQVTTYTQRTKGSTELSKVDSWTLHQSLPPHLTDEGTALWLDSITRIGYDTAGEPDSLNPIEFVGNQESMPNRVRLGAADKRPDFDRRRIERIVNEYGGETLVSYRSPRGPCQTGEGLPAPEMNTGLCYPVYWHPDPDKADETLSWFHKYVVDTVEEKPNIAGSPSEFTRYEYLGDGGGWALNQAEFSKKKTRTYDQWRGFGLVRTLTGADSGSGYTATQAGMTETVFFRGMDGDPLPGENKSREAVVKDAENGTIATDHLAYQGRVAETRTYTKAGGTLLTRTVDRPSSPQVLATRKRDGGIPALRAYRVLAAGTDTVTRYSGKSGDETDAWRTVSTRTAYDDTYGLPVSTEFLGDTARTGDESCTVNTYVHNTGAHLIGLSAQSLTTAGTCDKPGEWVSGSRVAYDKRAFQDAPTKGQATMTWTINAAGDNWNPSGTVTYDSLGRPTAAEDALKNTSTTTYTPASGQVYEVKTANALGHTTTTEIEPGRGVALRETDANGRTTAYTYDALGRTTEAWAPSQPRTEDPSVKFTYDISQGNPVNVTTSALNNEGTYDRSVVFYDGLGRERQTQIPAVGEGRLITDTLYSANGTVRQSNNAYYATGDPDGVMFDPKSDSEVQNATLYSYDGLGRVLTETPYLNGKAEPSKAVHVVRGYDHTTVVEPKGAATQRTWSDALGRTVRVDTFTDEARTKFRSSTYEFDARGNQVKATDAGGNSWSWDFDARGRQTKSVDPDTGTSTTTYDVLDRPVSTTDSRGNTVWTKYDALSRPVEQRRDNPLGERLTAATYDAVGALGLPASSTRYTDGLAYTSTVTGYTTDYQPLGEKLSLPPLVAQKYGLQETYTHTYEYARNGLLKSTTLPAAGTFGAEKVITRYNKDGLPVSTSGENWYAADTTYSPWGQVLRTASGENPSRVWTTQLFDAATGELTRQVVDRESTTDTTAVTGHRVNSRYYNYDDAGNVRQITDYSGGRTDRQCYAYDPIGQLTEAWTSPNDGCRATGKTERIPDYGDGTVNVTADNNGYWNSYRYDAVGNRTELVNHDPALNAANDTRTTYRYGTEDGKRPHTLSASTSTLTKDNGVRITEESTYDYDAAGNTTARRQGGDEQALAWTWDGQIEKITGFGASGEGAFVNTASGMCLDLTSGLTNAGTALQAYGCNGAKGQKFRIEAADAKADPATGQLKVVGRCAQPTKSGTSAGTLVVIAPCSSATASQQWTATSTGALKHVASGLCLTVPGTNPAVGTDMVLGACSGTGSVWAPADTTTYIYGPGGQRLLSVSAGQNVLHLGSTTVATTASKAPSYTERYYSQPGAPTVMRHAEGGAEATLSAQVQDNTGSAYVSVGLQQGNQVQFSLRDPFGVERTEDSRWRSHRGFVGGNDDDAAGLTHLGARMYDPYTGRFLSADPILDLADPVQMNGYVYAENNPVTYSDPSGLSSGIDASDYYDGPSASAVSDAKATMGTTMWDIILSNGWAVLGEFIGWGDIKACFGRGDLWACGSMVISAIPIGKLGKIPAVWKAIERIDAAIGAWRVAQRAAKQLLAAAERARVAAEKAAAAARAAAKKAAQAAKKRAAEARAAATRAAKEAQKKTGNAVQKAAKTNATKTAAKTQSTTARKQSKGDDSSGPGKNRKPDEHEGASEGGSCPINKTDNSFTPGTAVMMADGTTKPIEDVAIGDTVLTTDPETGETSPQKVTATITGKGTKHLVDITLHTTDPESEAETESGTKSAGGKGPAPTTLTATDGHPFWVPQLDTWIDAADLNTGQYLQTSAGTRIQITAITQRTTQATVHNLTVAGTHTYYVVAGTAPVLVHNCGSVYRGESRSPEEIQADGGFTPQAPGSSTTLYEYVVKNSPSNFVSTSKHANTAATFPAGGNAGLYVYEIRMSGGIDVNARLGPGVNPNAHEAEVAFEGGIPWSAVSRVWMRDPETGDIDFDFDDPIWERK
ncbi:RHS repeat-associated core domain-containing protein [Streptomyces albidoflavus]|uniref:scabin-related ADP-ribosyltransferase n=1 Tax=Streptomyces albidoflavus TaxID=1886 RepID=UPI0032559D22